MKLINITRGTLLADNVIVAHSFWRRLKGRLFTDDFVVGQALVIKRCSSIHTIGMTYCIDVIFVDASGNVIKGLATVKPYRAAICPGSKYVVELPAGTLAKTHTKCGDKIVTTV